jgi:AcrR family transcriptional regulator
VQGAGGEELGLRERKKRQTRRRIADTARELFADRGFERVTVADVARAADVSEQTVFNYFPTKEDLFYSSLEAFEDRLLAAVRERPAGTTVLSAFAAFLLDQRAGVLAMRDPAGDEDATERIRTITRVITESPALLARERQVFDRYARSLADLLAEETGVARGDVVAHVVANALVGLHRALIDHVRERVLAGASAASVRRSVQREARRAIAELERGLRDYGVGDGDGEAAPPGVGRRSPSGRG